MWEKESAMIGGKVAGVMDFARIIDFIQPVFVLTNYNSQRI